MFPSTKPSITITIKTATLSTVFAAFTAAVPNSYVILEMDNEAPASSPGSDDPVSSPWALFGGIGGGQVKDNQIRPPFPPSHVLQLR
ncbi:MAG: hypothetical protein Q9173_000735, partial [Seirophora scorigena]